MKKIWLVGGMALSSLLFSQTAPRRIVLAEVPLGAGHKVTVKSARNRPYYNPTKCDPDGNIYLRFYDPGDHFAVSKITPGGDLKRFALPSDAVDRQHTLYDFAVSASGTVLLPLQLGRDVYIVELADDGTVRRKTKLAYQFWVAHMIEFPDGRYFATGEEINEKDPAQPGETFNGLFDGSGNLIRRVRLRSDANLVQDEVVVKAISDSNKGGIATPPVSQDEAKQRATPSAVEKPPSDLALTLGDVESDRAGNLYVLRHSSPATIYVFDQNGKYQRKLSVAGPDPKRLAVTSMLVAPARLALTFEQVGDVNNPERVISIVDSTTGEELSRYSAGAELGSGPVCMTDNEFEFLTATPDAALVLDRVSLP